MPTSSREKIWASENGPLRVRYRKVKKAKRIRIQMSGAEEAVVTGPFFVPFRELENFFHQHQSWVAEKIRHFQKFPNSTIQLSPEDYKKKKVLARKLVFQKLEYWNQYYSFLWKRVAIRNQRTRWGSCSSRKTLSFHAAIVDLPESLQDYLIVHELCHLKHMNHSPAFWREVEKSLPPARALDARLKKYADTSIL